MRSLLVPLLLWSGIAAASAAGEQRPVHLVTIDDSIINPVVTEYLEKAIDRAEKEEAQALIIQLDTPGGLLSSTRVIVKRIMNAEVPVVVYVGPSGARAGSAGVFITLASHVAAMAPSTNIGAAHPVELGQGPQKEEKEGWRELLEGLRKKKEEGEEKEKSSKKDGVGKRPPEVEGVEGADAMSQKILNDTVAWVTTIAETRGRNASWAERAVRESISSGEEEAKRLHVVDHIARDVPELLALLDGSPVTLASGRQLVLHTSASEVISTPMTFRQRLLDVLINPNIAYILMMLGFYGLLFEITHPGSWIPGIAGLICIILAFYAFHTLPTNYAGGALIMLAIALFVAEAFVPSFGLLTLGGVVSMVLGSLFLIDSAAEFMQVSLKVILPVVLATAFVFVFLVTLAVRSQRQVSLTSQAGMIGATGVAVGPSKIEVSGELWDAASEQALRPGDRVKVVGVDGMKLNVRKAT